MCQDYYQRSICLPSSQSGWAPFDLVPKDKMGADTGGQSEVVFPDVVIGRTRSGVEKPGDASLL
jgi:hypothetical protein